MPYRRRYRRRYRKRTTAVSPRVKRYVRKQVHRNIENKFSNTELTDSYTSIGSSWIETDLTALSQGDGVNQRSGNEIKTMGFSLNGVLVGGQVNLAADDKLNTVRIVLALWDSTTQTPLADNSATISSYVSRRSNVGRGLIRKFMDKTIVLRTPGRDSTGYLPSVRYLKFFKRIKTTVRYYNNVITAANVKLVLSIISDSSVVPNPGFTSGKFNLFWEDG